MKIQCSYCTTATANLSSYMFTEGIYLLFSFKYSINALKRRVGCFLLHCSTMVQIV